MIATSREKTVRILFLSLNKKKVERISVNFKIGQCHPSCRYLFTFCLKSTFILQATNCLMFNHVKFLFRHEIYWKRQNYIIISERIVLNIMEKFSFIAWSVPLPLASVLGDGVRAPWTVKTIPSSSWADDTSKREL